MANNQNRPPVIPPPPPPAVAILPPAKPNAWTVQAPGFPEKVVEAPDTAEAIRLYGLELGVWGFANAPVATPVVTGA